MSKRLLIGGLAVALLAAAPGVAAAAPGGTERPFEADLVGEIHFELGAPECADFGPVRSHAESSGIAMHMGLGGFDPGADQLLKQVDLTWRLWCSAR